MIRILARRRRLTSHDHHHRARGTLPPPGFTEHKVKGIDYVIGGKGPTLVLAQILLKFLQ
jgi:hypothetical protein